MTLKPDIDTSVARLAGAAITPENSITDCERSLKRIRAALLRLRYTEMDAAHDTAYFVDESPDERVSRRKKEFRAEVDEAVSYLYEALNSVEAIDEA